MSDLCPRCNGPVLQAKKGPRRIFCSDRCKSAVLKKRRRDAARAARPPKPKREPAPLRSAQRPTRPRYETSATFEGTPATSATFEGTPATPATFEGTPATPATFEIPAFDAPALGDDEIDLDLASLGELRGQCRARGLDSTGDREDLITRILAFEAESEYPDEGDNDLDYADPDLDHADPADDGLLDAYLATLPDAPPAPEPSPTFETTRRKWQPDPSPTPTRPAQRPAPSKRREPIRYAW